MEVEWTSQSAAPGVYQHLDALDLYGIGIFDSVT